MPLRPATPGHATPVPYPPSGPGLPCHDPPDVPDVAAIHVATAAQFGVPSEESEESELSSDDEEDAAAAAALVALASAVLRSSTSSFSFDIDDFRVLITDSTCLTEVSWVDRSFSRLLISA